MIIKKSQIYKLKTYDLINYYKYMYQRFGTKWMFSLTDTKYPQFLALGCCDYTNKEIVVCKIFDWKLRIAHEFGHAIGLKHIMQKDRVMHPWGFKRGWKLDGE